MANLITEIYSLPTEAFLNVLLQYDELGEQAFLEKYPSDQPTSRHICAHGDLRFPPMPIIAAAYSNIHGRIPTPDGGLNSLEEKQLKEIFTKHGIEVLKMETKQKKSLLQIDDRNSVHRAIQEFDHLGRNGFLRKYGFGQAKSYFILHKGKVYDSKAIAGVARGYEHPELGPLTHQQFSGGEKRVAKLMRELGFTIVKNVPAELDTPLVLVQNERTEDSKYDFWDDATGERYHYANQHRNKVRTGRRFIYYKGSRRRDGSSKTPEYFGWGVIGDVERDPDTAGSNKKLTQRWICRIAEYTPFEKPVLFKLGDKPFEDIPQNHWSMAVRILQEGVCENILSHAGVSIAPSAPAEVKQPLLPLFEDAVAQPANDSLMRPTTPTAQLGSGFGGGSPHSKFSRELGERGQEIVLDFLKQELPDKEKATLSWTTQEGRKPGWDIEYKSDGRIIGVKAKATGGSYFPSIELTANEWRAAEEKGSDYRLALVSDVWSEKPWIEFIENPFEEVKGGGFAVEPLSWRLVRRG